MTTLMAQIATKVLEESKLVAAEEVSNQPPADAPIEYPEKEVPASVKSSLQKEIDFHMEHANGYKESGDEEKTKFHFATAEFLSELKVLLDKGDEHHYKLASVAVHSAKNSIQNKIPKEVYDYLVPRLNKSLQERFTEVLAGKKTG